MPFPQNVHLLKQLPYKSHNHSPVQLRISSYSSAVFSRAAFEVVSSPVLYSVKGLSQ